MQKRKRVSWKLGKCTQRDRNRLSRYLLLGGKQQQVHTVSDFRVWGKRSEEKARRWTWQELLRTFKSLFMHLLKWVWLLFFHHSTLEKQKSFKSPFPLCTILALLHATVINNKQIPFFACLLSNYCDHQQFFSGVGPQFFCFWFCDEPKKFPGCYQHLFWDFFWICGFVVMLCFLGFCEQRDKWLGNWGSEDGEKWDHFWCVCVWVLGIVWGRRWKEENCRIWKSYGKLTDFHLSMKLVPRMLHKTSSCRHSTLLHLVSKAKFLFNKSGGFSFLFFFDRWPTSRAYCCQTKTLFAKSKSSSNVHGRSAKHPFLFWFDRFGKKAVCLLCEEQGRREKEIGKQCQWESVYVCMYNQVCWCLCDHHAFLQVWFLF